MRPARIFTLLSLIVIVGGNGWSAEPSDPLAPWRSGVAIHEVAPGRERHTIHSYFNTCPESPDGTQVVFFSSTTPDSQRGDICVRDRKSSDERILVRDLGTEDAHRVACQQWASGGRRVVFHGERDGNWFVGAVGVASGTERVLAPGRLKGWGQPNSDLVPLYGPHWDAKALRDLEMLNVETGAIDTPLKVDAVKAAYPEWFAKSFGDTPTSIFFPVLSPDAQRVFFKMATPGNGDPRSSAASARQGLVCYSLGEKRFLFMRGQWGHPSWQPDSRTITETSFTLFDSNDGGHRRVPGLPSPRGDHPSISPDGRLFVTDTTLDVVGGNAKEWGIIVADARGNDYVVIHHFDNSHGATSWRRSHPHPIFSPDSRRIYFNVSSGRWTQLYVAEAATPR
jgi:Tol biopolymer transport system component